MTSETQRRCAITIGLPLYNDALYVSRALESLLAQTFTDFEIVISDNGSTDASPEICAQYVRKDNRVRYVRQPYNLGVRDNFLLLINQAESEFFMWAASDDMWHPEFLRQCLGALRRNPECAVAFGPFVFIDEEDQLIGEVQDFDFSGSTPLRRLLRLNCNFHEGRDAFWYGLYRRELIKDLRIRYWWWVNADILVNTAYPVLAFILARGNYAHVGTQPLWLNRLHRCSKPRDSGVLKTRRFTAGMAFLLRQVNIVCYCVGEVFRARKSIALTAMVVPIFILRSCADTVLGLVGFTFHVARKVLKIVWRDSPAHGTL